MRFQVLGPLHVLGEDGRPLRLEPREQRVLAVLLLAANTVVTRDWLIDAVWDDDPPATARRQLLNCVSRLRRRVDGIESGHTGYGIHLEPSDLDALLFAEHVAAARAATSEAAAVRRLRSALALWRGPALAGLGGRAVQAGAARLNEQRLTALEQCVDLELALGRHDGLAGELTEWVATHPLSERLVSQLMLALHRSGRKADALAAYRRLSAQLAEDLGIDPSESLQSLHSAILRNEVPAGSRSAGVLLPRQLPASARHFVGRHTELKELNRLVDEVGTGDSAVIAVVDGTAGIGKTALVLRWAHGAAQHFPDGQLYIDLRGFDPSGKPVTPSEAIRGFLGSLAVAPERVPADLPDQAALYRSLISGRRMLVVLENARDSNQVRALLPGGSSCLTVVSSRVQLTGLVAAEGAYPLTLELLPTGEALELLARHLGSERVAREPQVVQELISDCAGLPLALSIVAARASLYPALPLSAFAGELANATRRLDALDAGDGPAQVRGVFSWSYRGLSQPAARLFRRLGLHPGHDFNALAACAAAGEDAREAIRELTRANLVTEPATGRFAMHDLLRLYATELVSGPDSAAELRILDHYLHTAVAADRLLYPLRDRIDIPAPLNGAAPASLTSHVEAMDWFVAEHRNLLACLQRARQAGLDPHAWRLAWAMANFLERRGHWQDWIATQTAAWRSARRVGDWEIQALASRSLGRAFTRVSKSDRALRHLSRALILSGMLGDRVNQAHAHVNLAQVFELQEQYQDALSHSHQALDLYRAAGHRLGQANALNAAGWFKTLLGEYRDALAHCEQALAIHRAIGHRYGEAATLDSLGVTHDRLGQHAEAIVRFEQALEIDRQLGDRYVQATVLTHLGDAHDAAGAPSQAASAWRQALDILDELQHPDAEAVRSRFSR